MNRLATIALLCLLQAIFALFVHPCYAFRPRGARLLEAELVVLGRLTNVREEKDQILGEIAIEKMLKGTTTGKKIPAKWQKGMPSPAPTETTADSLQDGTRGIWFLVRDRDSQLFRGLTAGPAAAANEVDEIEWELAELRELKWSKPEHGLTMALVVEVQDVEGDEVWSEGQLVAAKATVAVFPVAKNTLDHDLLVADCAADHPFTAIWSRPGSWDWKTALYSSPKRDLLEESADQFQRVRPNQICQIGHGFVFPPLVDDGQYTLTIKFSSQRGKTSQKGSVWKGTLELPTFRLKLPLEIFEDDSKQDK
jgi:hypothetical protein